MEGRGGVWRLGWGGWVGDLGCDTLQDLGFGVGVSRITSECLGSILTLSCGCRGGPEFMRASLPRILSHVCSLIIRTSLFRGRTNRDFPKPPIQGGFVWVFAGMYMG